ncbi:MAG TPA: DNA gyrase/topoisomerase IV subunit A, partial [Leeuwenhoekiella sp.]|nr:DNA gyrase/topoisomerase IV subunit A [Leeuwenhoekiella sp.]
RKIWFDDTIQRLNVDGRGELLGEFKGEDRLLIITQDGIAKTITPELTTRFDDKMIVLEKWIPAKPISAIYWDGNRERYYVKRFLIDNPEKEESFVSDHENTQLELVSTDHRPVVEMVFYKERNKDQKPNETVDIEDFISIKGINALGNQFYTEKLKQINLLDPLPYEEPVEAQPEQDVETPSESEETAHSENDQEDHIKGDGSQGSLF